MSRPDDGGDSPAHEPLVEHLRQLLLEQQDGGDSLPTSTVRRLGRTAFAGLRGARLVRRLERQARAGKSDGGAGELEALSTLVLSVGRLKGIAMKVAQVMSYIDLALPDELRAALSALQTHAQPMSPAQVRELITADLGPERAAELLAQLSPRPLAAASIGQVHAAVLPDGTRVAVKVRYPEIDRAIAADFGPASFGTRIAGLLYPNARVGDFIAEARQRFLEECDYLHEARAQQRFAALFADHPTLAVPAVHPRYCGARVLTTELVVDALPFDGFLASDPPASVRDRLGVALFEFYVGTLFRHGLYNCDPHPGNYLWCSDGRLAMLDYGCTREFPPELVARLARLTFAVHADERAALEQAFIDLGLVRPGQRYDFATARALVRGFYGPMLRDETQVIDLGEARDMRSMYQSKKQLLQLSLPGEFLFLFRIRFGLMSVLAGLGARANWYRLEREWATAALG